MKQVEAYRCDYCGKVYLTECRCKRHEEHSCCHHPAIQPLCYSCQYYKAEYNHKEQIVCRSEAPFDKGTEIKKEFDLNTCLHPKKQGKLFNNFKLSNEMRRALSQASFIPMPNLKSGGCNYYRPILRKP